MVDDRRQTAKERQEQIERQQQAVSDWEFMLDQPQCRRVLAGLMSDFGLFAACSTPEAEGMRRAALMLYASITRIGQDDHLTAILAEMRPRNVGRDRSNSRDRSSGDTADD